MIIFSRNEDDWFKYLKVETQAVRVLRLNTATPQRGFSSVHISSMSLSNV